MTPFWTGFLVGGAICLVLGACFGVVLCALCVMAGRNDPDKEGRR